MKDKFSIEEQTAKTSLKLIAIREGIEVKTSVYGANAIYVELFKAFNKEMKNIKRLQDKGTIDNLEVFLLQNNLCETMGTELLKISDWVNERMDEILEDLKDI